MVGHFLRLPALVLIFASSLSLSLHVVVSFFCTSASARVRFNRHFCADKRRARIVRLSVRQPPSQPQFLADSGGQLTRVPYTSYCTPQGAGTAGHPVTAEAK